MDNLAANAYDLALLAFYAVPIMGIAAGLNDWLDNKQLKDGKRKPYERSFTCPY